MKVVILKFPNTQACTRSTFMKRSPFLLFPTPLFLRFFLGYCPWLSSLLTISSLSNLFMLVTPLPHMHYYLPVRPFFFFFLDEFSSVQSLSHVDSLQPHGLQHARLPCPPTPRVYSNSCPSYHLIPWNSPGQNTGVSSLSLLQRIFPTQGSNPGVPHCR